MKHLEIDKFYMEPNSGSVNTGKDWQEIYEEAKKETSFNEDEWDEDTLIEVRLVNKQWKEVEY